MISFSFINKSSTALTYTTLGQALNSAGFVSSTTLCPANGFYITSASMHAIIGVYGTSGASSSALGFRYVDLMSLSSSTATIRGSLYTSTSSFSSSSSWTVNDKVVAIGK